MKNWMGVRGARLVLLGWQIAHCAKIRQQLALFQHMCTADTLTGNNSTELRISVDHNQD